MIYCVNPSCKNPRNLESAINCYNCGLVLLLNNRFRPIDLVGVGGFGRTFKAIDEHSIDESKCLVKQFFTQNSNVASNSRVKVQAKTLIPGQQAANKTPDIYRKEVNQLSRLRHPQIPSLITHFEQDGYSYLVQEFIDGVNLLTELVRQGGFSESQIWQILKDLLPVLKFIHDHNVIHRDIKPENIIRPLNDHPLVLVDFGAAKLVAPQTIAAKTQLPTGTAIGTPNYMPPEQERGREVFASDLYSLGVTCICLLTNSEPHSLFDDGSNSWEWRSRCKGVSKKLGKLLDKLLELGTQKRYKSADEVIQDLDQESWNKRLNSQNITLWEKLTALGTVTQGLAAILTLLITFGLIKIFTPRNIDPLEKISIESNKGIDYKLLREYLRQNNWQAADSETYELILKLGGYQSQSQGQISFDKINNISCHDLQVIDNLWRTASEGKLGFSAQQKLYEQNGRSWQKMYEKVGWGTFNGNIFIKSIEQEFDWQTRRMRYKVGKEPVFINPIPGHLPVTVNIVQGIEFPQFAEICKF